MTLDHLGTDAHRFAAQRDWSRLRNRTQAAGEFRDRKVGTRAGIGTYPRNKKISNLAAELVSRLRFKRGSQQPERIYPATSARDEIAVTFV